VFARVKMWVDGERGLRFMAAIQRVRVGSGRGATGIIRKSVTGAIRVESERGQHSMKRRRVTETRADRSTSVNPSAVNYTCWNM